MENIHPIRQQYFENEFEQRTNGRAEKLLLEESCDKANIFLTSRAGGIWNFLRVSDFIAGFVVEILEKNMEAVLFEG